MKVRPTKPPRTPAIVRSRVGRGAIGAGAIAAGLVIACGGKTTASNGGTDIVAPQDPPQSECGPMGQGPGFCRPPQVAPQDPPQIAPQPPPPQPPQPFDAGIDADASDAEDAG